jgi:hypothetical protein
MSLNIDAAYDGDKWMFKNKNAICEQNCDKMIFLNASATFEFQQYKAYMYKLHIEVFTDRLTRPSSEVN